MPRTPKTVTLTWRDESYGGIGRSFAFRAKVERYPSDAAADKLARIYRRNGFKLNESRMAWIAEQPKDDAPLLLAEALEAAGYEVGHKGAVPQCIEDLQAGSAPRI